MEFFYNWTLSTRLLEKQADCQSRIHELYRESRKKLLNIALSETPYPAFPGSNAINSYVYFVELFSESLYSWLPSRSTNIHDSQVFKTKILDSYLFCNYNSWFMIGLPPPREGPSLLIQLRYNSRLQCWTSWIPRRTAKKDPHLFNIHLTIFD